jgi:membrane-bound serine protease (ClpP class)
MTTLSIIALLIVGILLMLVELLVLPGFGVAGALGVVALIGGAVGAWYELGPLWGAMVGAVSAVLAIVMVYIIPRTKAGRRLVLQEELKDHRSQKDQRPLLGRRGVTVTPLRPIGRVRFGQEEVDVVTDGEYIPSDAEVEVVDVQGMRVVVALLSKPALEPSVEPEGRQG